MSVRNNIENNNDETNFLNIKIIILGVLFSLFIIGGFCYYFITDKSFEEPVQEVIEDNQETESDNQNNNEEIISNQDIQKKEEEKIFLIDNIWISYLTSFIIITTSLLLVFNVQVFPFRIAHCKTTTSEDDKEKDNGREEESKIRYYLQRLFIDEPHHAKMVTKDNKIAKEKVVRSIHIRNLLKAIIHYLFYLLFTFFLHLIFSLIGSGISKIKSSQSYWYILKKSLFHFPTSKGFHIIWIF